jgi:cysteine-rich repeat protein
MDGLALQGCEPTFLAARDAILLSDQNANSGANRCLLWAGFAKRGLGFGATNGGGAGSLDVQEDFDTPPECVPFCGDALLHVGEECDDGNGDFFDGCAPTCRVTTVFGFVGVALGGSIDLVIDGIAIHVPTSEGETAADVAANVVAAIDAELGLTAAALGSQVATTGDLTSFVVNDPGLQPPAIPALSGGARWVLGAALLLAAALRLHWRRAGGVV